MSFTLSGKYLISGIRTSFRFATNTGFDSLHDHGLSSGPASYDSSGCEVTAASLPRPQVPADSAAVGTPWKAGYMRNLPAGTKVLLMNPVLLA
jgi:hypothetical protein